MKSSSKYPYPSHDLLTVHRRGTIQRQRPRLPVEDSGEKSIEGKI